jgi:hypothetical protein
MEIEYGQNDVPAAVINVATGEIYPFNGRTEPKSAPEVTLPPTITGATAKMFAFLGGEQHTKEGFSGAGRLPDDANLVQCAVLRADMKRPPAPPHTPVGQDDVRCVVTSQAWRINADSWVILVRESAQHGTEVFFAKNRPDAVLKILHNPAAARRGPKKEFTLRSYGLFGNDGEICDRTIGLKLYGFLSTEVGTLSKRRLLELVFWAELFSPGAFRRHRVTEWEQGLGLATAIDGNRYSNVCGILRNRFLPPRNWQKSFSWVTFVGDPRHGFTDGSLYMVVRKGQHRLVANYPLRQNGSKSEYEVAISDEMAAAMKQSGQLTPALVNDLLPPAAAPEGK